MKITLKNILTLFVGVLLFYTACKKTGSSPSTTSKSPSEQTISGQIALNLAQSLTGTYGGANINDGLSLPSFLNNNTSSHVVNSLHTTWSCGDYVDTTINIKTNIGDTIKSTTTGALKFFFKCAPNGSTQGFALFDSLRTVGKAPGYSFTDLLIQHFNVVSLDAANKHIAITTGNITTWVDITYDKPSITPFSLHTKFLLTGLKIDLTTSPPDITDGVATFVSSGSSSAGSFHSSGRITFLGGHMAKVTVNGFLFHVNFLTGVVTPG